MNDKECGICNGTLLKEQLIIMIENVEDSSLISIDELRHLKKDHTEFFDKLLEVICK